MRIDKIAQLLSKMTDNPGHRWAGWLVSQQGQSRPHKISSRGRLNCVKMHSERTLSLKETTNQAKVERGGILPALSACYACTDEANGRNKHDCVSVLWKGDYSRATVV